jgi:polysaccharide biosynthesis/export protein
MKSQIFCDLLHKRWLNECKYSRFNYSQEKSSTGWNNGFCMVSVRGQLMLFLLFLLPLLQPAYAADYKIGPNDIIKVTVFDYPDLTTETRVNETGTLTLPLLGELPVVGLTTTETERLIALRLSTGGFINQAIVSVMVSQFLSQQISVLGEVNKPGNYSMERIKTVTDLLATANGVTAAGGDNAILVRKTPEGQRSKIDIDLLLLFQGDEKSNIKVRNGDVFYVPRAAVFFIYGEVQRPGMYRIERNMTVAQAISVGGGLTAKGSENSITIRRAVGRKTESIDFYLDGQLLPNDVIVIGERWF